MFFYFKPFSYRVWWRTYVATGRINTREGLISKAKTDYRKIFTSILEFGIDGVNLIAQRCRAAPVNFGHLTH